MIFATNNAEFTVILKISGKKKKRNSIFFFPKNIPLIYGMNLSYIAIYKKKRIYKIIHI